MRTTGKPYRRSTGIKGSFDCIIVGSGMGGMTAAVMLAKQDKKVLLLEQNSVVGGLTQSYERGGYRWNTGLHYVGNLGHRASMTSRLFRYVTDDKIDWVPMPSIYNKIVVEDRVYPIPAGREAYAKALMHWFPKEVDAITSYMDMVGAVSKTSGPYFGQKAFPEAFAKSQGMDIHPPFHEHADRTTLEVLSELTSDHELIAILCGNWGDYSSPPHRSSFAMHCMLNQHYMNGGSYPKGGAGKLADAMIPIVEGAGGMVLHSAEVSQILVDDAKAVGVKLTSGEEVMADVVVSNAGVQNTFGRLMDPSIARAVGMEDNLQNTDDTYALVGINLGLNCDAATLGLEAANIWAHPSTNFEANLEKHWQDFSNDFPWVFVTFPSVKDSDWQHTHPNKSTIEMYAYTNFEHFEHWRETRWMKRGDSYLARKQDIKTRLLDQLEKYVPSVRNHIEVAEVSTPLTYETFTKRERGGFMGIESTPGRFQQSWLRATTPVQGLYLSGQDVTTDGVIGALTGGVIGASAVVGENLMEVVMRETAE